PNSV
ncbi:ferritin-like domain protein, partial [Vibrio parahaemolyticus V-223/04]